MAQGIFLLQDNGELVEMTESPYDSEDLLQTLLEKYPRLLAGDQFDSAAPHRWLLVKREMEIPSEEAGTGRWSLDHLFLDQDAIPTLVEVKRSTDSRIRREVVGQMLDYASNAVVYWPIERLIAEFEKNCGVANSNPEDVLKGFLEGDQEPEQFWEKAKTNLQAGKVRLVFVADVIPTELRRIVEFLNEQMDPAEVIAIEVRQFVGEGMKSLVPRVIGQTAEAQKRKGTARSTRQWDEPSFFDEFTLHNSVKEKDAVKLLLSTMRECGAETPWGKGSIFGSFHIKLQHGDNLIPVARVTTDGKIEINFGNLKDYPPFDDIAERRELLSRLNAIGGASIPEDKW